MIKCPECNSLVDENLKECDKCGYPFNGTEEQVDSCDKSDEKQDEQSEVISSSKEIKGDEQLDPEKEKEEKKEQKEMPDTGQEAVSPTYEYTGQPEENKKKGGMSKRALIIAGVCVFAVICGFVLYLTSDYGKYNSATKAYQNKNYAEAAKKYKDLGDYKDASKMYKKAKHKNDVVNDKEAPAIFNVPTSISLEQGENLDAQQWLSNNKISAKDNVSSDIVCEVDLSKVDTSKAGTYSMTVSAADEAGNVQTKDVSVTVKRIYTQDEIVAAVKSTYFKDIPGLDRIEYDQKNQTVWVYLVNSGMADAAVGARANSQVKSKWDSLMNTFNDMSKKIYSHIQKEGYTDVQAVSIMLLNDLDTSKMLYTTVNGIKFADVTDK